jgi:hypothetical protein
MVWESGLVKGSYAPSSEFEIDQLTWDHLVGAPSDVHDKPEIPNASADVEGQRAVFG